ncbi:uncharacterized protein LOC125718171 isoform X2 [Brienomyrus brachyistius]|uniref:uncharacterized protein LOC125718171 isoform X2 n=1 Tax=Brienomyrus brachyistius TaxID=42636 RepID=UPI0020B324BE|nr:uncharacterized protein LOC125718171 isoform X2 [Brienomyrus brachyistius]
MSSEMSLYELLDLSMGATQAGTVNFCALRSLLCAILERLNLVQNGDRTEGADSPLQPKPGLSPRRSVSHCQQIEENLRRVEEQMVALERLPRGSDLIRSKSEVTVSEMWQIMQISRKVQANEDGVSQAMALIQDLLTEIRDLREARDTLTSEVKGLQEMLSQLNLTELRDRTSSLEQCCHQVSGMEKTLGELQERLKLYPQSTELTQYVSWEVLQDTLVGEREQTRQEQPFVATPTQVDTPETTPPPPSRVVSAAPPAPTTAGSTPLPPPDEVVAPQHVCSDAPMTGAECYPEAVEALQHVGRLRDAHEVLGTRVMRLENGKADQNELQALRDLLGRAANRQELDRLQAELSHLQVQTDLLTADREKVTWLRLQAECEKLHDCTRHLEEEYSLRQKHIDELYKSMEELIEKKADKDHVEMEIEIKADKGALETKVSRKQFDEMTKHLGAMLEELLGKVSDQEQDWHRIIEKISGQMDSKLDSVKKQLEGRWKLILKHPQMQPTQDDAAGIRKQLVNQVHCISCDRPIAASVPGPHLVTVPLAPSFPPHKSSRPHSFYEMEQVRQHYQSERIPEPEGSGFLPMSRGCGGSHTLTQPSRRYLRQQHLAHAAPPEEEASPQGARRAQAEEMDVLGLDGHVYRGRQRSMEIRLPNISKEGTDRSRAAKTALPQRAGATELGSRTPRRPHSAESQRGPAGQCQAQLGWMNLMYNCGSIAFILGRQEPSSTCLTGQAASSLGCICETDAPISLAQPALDGQLDFSQSPEDGTLTSL